MEVISPDYQGDIRCLEHKEYRSACLKSRGSSRYLQAIVAKFNERYSNHVGAGPLRFKHSRNEE